MFGFQLPVVTALGTSSAYFIAILISLHRRGFFSWLQGTFTLYLLLSILWSVGHALVIWRGLIPLMPQMGWELSYSIIIALPVMLAALTVLFFEWPRAHWIAIIGGVLALLVAVIDNNLFQAQALLLHNLNMASAKELLHSLRWLVWGVFGLSAVVLTIWNYAITWRPLHRNRILYWLISLLTIVAGEGITLTLDPWLVQVGLVVRMVGVLLMTFTLVSYYLPSLRNIARKSLVTTLVTLIMGGLYWLVFWYVVLSLTGLDLMLRLATLAVVALIMAVFTPPLQRRLQGILDKLLLGGRYDPARALREYSAAISNILDLNMLVTIAIGIISEAMETKRGAFLLLTEREGGAADVRIIPGMGELAVTEAEFSPGSPILSHLLTNTQPLTHYEIDVLPQLRSAPLAERTWLQNIHMELYVPILQQSSMVGIIALGERAGGAPYSLQDMNVLSTLADQTTVALQNARLVSDLKALNEQMVNLNEELINANRRLEKLDAAKSDFIQIASHELRTPLTQVRGYADMMSDMIQSGAPGSTQFLQVGQGISRATLRLEEIIKAMLDVSQIDAEALNLTCTPLAMTTAIRMSLEPYRDAIGQRGQILTVEGLEGLPPVPGDLQRLCQAFGNIIVNAIKYTPDGGQITISGRVSQTIDDGGGGKLPSIELVFADTGIGVEPADLELIFEKFYRIGSVSLHSTGTTKFMGAGPGLGLAIAKGVIQAHGGLVWAESEGRDEKRFPGSRFHVVLPALNPEPPA